MGKLVQFACNECDFAFTGKFGIGKTDLALGTQNFASEEEREVGVNFSQYIVDNPHEVDFIREFIRKHRPVILKTWNTSLMSVRIASDFTIASPTTFYTKAAISSPTSPAWTAGGLWSSWI